MRIALETHPASFMFRLFSRCVSLWVTCPEVILVQHTIEEFVNRADVFQDDLFGVLAPWSPSTGDDVVVIMSLFGFLSD